MNQDPAPIQTTRTPARQPLNVAPAEVAIAQPPTGLTAMLVAHELERAAECRRAVSGWRWHGKWSAKDWKDSARSHVELARKLRRGGLNELKPPVYRNVTL